MKVKERMVIVSGFPALLATALVAATYNLQTAKACSAQDQPYGKSCVSPEAKSGGFGTAVSSLAQSSGGLHDFRAAGDKGGPSPGDVGSGGSDTNHGNHG
jgi:hypothetical protein